MTTIPLSIVDAFCIPGESFSGNQAAVCLLQFDDEIPDGVKQKIGTEMNLSETAFVAYAWSASHPRKSEFDYTLRWFTPTDEIALCGHATLASARVLFDRMGVQNKKETTINFETKYKGMLSATMNWETKRISINFPLTPVTPYTERDYSHLPKLLDYLLEPLGVSQIHSVNMAVSTKYLFVRLHDEIGEKGLLELQPNFSALSKLEGDGLPFGIIATVKGNTNGDVHVYSRFFAPNLGVPEDPVTGSAHCALMSYWSTELGLTKMLAKQSSKRGGHVHCEVDKFDSNRVNLQGLTKSVVKGELLL